MVFSDNLGQLLNEIKMGQRRKKMMVICRKSKLNISILLKLINEGLIYSFNEVNLYSIQIWLKYNHLGEPLIYNLKRISLVSRRRYLKVSEIKTLTKATDNKLFILTTSKGILTNKEAVVNNIGGEVLFQIN